MHETFISQVAAKHCKYRYLDQNIAEMRRAKLRTLVAGPLGLSKEGSKNDLLQNIIHKLDNMGAEIEISELGKKPEKAKKKRKKVAKKK